MKTKIPSEKKKRSYKIFYLILSKRNQQKLVLNSTEGLEQREGESWVFLCLGKSESLKEKGVRARVVIEFKSERC